MRVSRILVYLMFALASGEIAATLHAGFNGAFFAGWMGSLLASEFLDFWRAANGGKR